MTGKKKYCRFPKFIVNQQYLNFYTIPCAIIASATFTKPAILAPFS